MSSKKKEAGMSGWLTQRSNRKEKKTRASLSEKLKTGEAVYSPPAAFPSKKELAREKQNRISEQLAAWAGDLLEEDEEDDQEGEFPREGQVPTQSASCANLTTRNNNDDGDDDDDDAGNDDDNDGDDAAKTNIIEATSIVSSDLESVKCASARVDSEDDDDDSNDDDDDNLSTRSENGQRRRKKRGGSSKRKKALQSENGVDGAVHRSQSRSCDLDGDDDDDDDHDHEDHDGRGKSGDGNDGDDDSDDCKKRMSTYLSLLESDDAERVLSSGREAHRLARDAGFHMQVAVVLDASMSTEVAKVRKVRSELDYTRREIDAIKRQLEVEIERERVKSEAAAAVATSVSFDNGALSRATKPAAARRSTSGSSSSRGGGGGSGKSSSRRSSAVATAGNDVDAALQRIDSIGSASTLRAVLHSVLSEHPEVATTINSTVLTMGSRIKTRSSGNKPLKAKSRRHRNRSTSLRTTIAATSAIQSALKTREQVRTEYEERHSIDSQ
jgi:hypothetical protein